MSIRIKLLLPGLIALAGLAAWLVITQRAPKPAVLATAAALLLAVQWAAHERWVAAGLKSVRDALACGTFSGVRTVPGGEWQELMQRVSALRQHAEADRLALDHASAQALSAEEALRLSEQRHALTLRGANDGMWEWDCVAQRLLVSPRWTHMFGLHDSDSMSLAEWRERLHPEDRDCAVDALQAHLDGATERYEHAHRLLHADGAYRWVLSRGTVVRRASGTPHRVLGLDTDITKVKRAEGLIEAIADGTANACGAPFFQALVMHFARALHVDCAFITECADLPATRARTLAFWRRDGFDANFEYDLPGTPCENVFREGQRYFYPRGLGERYACERGQEGYLGMPIFGRDGLVIGHLAFVHGEPLCDDVLMQSVYRIFTARAGVEIELSRALRR
ncbi:MAG TPA: PAS domain-containing protein [Burkholderiaceae bacterium]|nr:PAS domain-containing protein [Burkholderiaceae bacterium]